MHRRLLLIAALLVVAWCVMQFRAGAPTTPGADLGPEGDRDAIDLLLRQPDEVFELPGRLVPSAEFGWGPHGGVGWDSWRPEWVSPDGAPWMQTNQPLASLRLACPVPEERTLELEVWQPGQAGAEEAGTVDLRLNGQSLGTHALERGPSLLRLTVSADRWRLGANLLELEVPVRGGGGPAGPRRWVALALAGVSYGEERRVIYDVARRSYVLAPGTGLRYLVETRGDARLAIRGSADGPGQLTLGIGGMQARNGLPAPDGQRIELPVGGKIELVQPLPRVAASTIPSIEFAWQPADGRSPFRFDRARVFEESPHPRPNVVLVSIDTLAARHLSVYGYERRTTPALERFAEDAILFERCVANAPWTLPSYLSALTGLYPLSHFVELQHAPGVEFDNYDFWQVAQSRWTLAEALRARGYQTAASLDTYWLSPRFQVNQGFDVYDLEAATYPFDDPEKGVRFILQRFGPWLDEARRPSAPFFAFIHALDAHGPYWPEAPFSHAFEDGLPEEPRMIPAGSALQTFGSMPTWMAYSACPPELRRDLPSAWEIPAKLPLEEIVARYDEAILKVDASLGELFDLLKERGLYDDTVIVITGDHGESFAHDVYSHGVLWEDVVQVPLMIKLPANERGGTRIATSVQLVDLYPTLLELAGAGPARDYLHGRSLLELRAGAVSARPTFSQGGHVDQAMIESDGWKLVEVHPGRGCIASVITHPVVRKDELTWIEEQVPDLARSRVLSETRNLELQGDRAFGQAFGELKQRLATPYYQLFDLGSDPDELVDLSGAHPERVKKLKALLRGEIQRAREAQADGRPEPPRGEFSAEARDRLQALGYAGDEGG